MNGLKTASLNHGKMRWSDDRPFNQAKTRKLLAFLKKHGNATTIQIRHELDILMPATPKIGRTWELAHNQGGTDHRLARYVLQEGEYQEATI